MQTTIAIAADRLRGFSQQLLALITLLRTALIASLPKELAKSAFQPRKPVIDISLCTDRSSVQSCPNSLTHCLASYKLGALRSSRMTSSGRTMLRRLPKSGADYIPKLCAVYQRISVCMSYFHKIVGGLFDEENSRLIDIFFRNGGDKNFQGMILFQVLSMYSMRTTLVD